MKKYLYNGVIIYIIVFNFSIAKSFYKGSWKNGMYHGKGVHLDNAGSKYEGDFIENKEHGYGTMVYYNGAKFEGTWLKNKKLNGTYYFSDGTIWKGSWKGNKRDGEGVFIDERGNEIDQLWIDGELMTKLYDEDASFEFSNLNPISGSINNEKNKNRSNAKVSC